MLCWGAGNRSTVLGRLFGVQKDDNDDDGRFIDEANLYKKDLLVIHNRLDSVARGTSSLTNDELGSLIEKYGRSASLGK